MKSPTRRSPSLGVGDRIVSALESDILSGRLVAGGRLPTEQMLAKRHGVSRAAVREAIQVLKARGLAVSRRGSGCFVAENGWEAPLQRSLERYAILRSDLRTFHELLDLRKLVEVFCIRRLAAVGGALALDELGRCLARMEAERGDLHRFGHADFAFHLAIVEGSGNELIATIYRGLIPGLGERFVRATYTEIDLVEKTLVDHRGILAALRAGRVEWAAKVLEQHIEWARRHLVEIVGGMGL